MKIIDDILQHIAYSILNNEYVWTDPEKVAIIDNSHVASDWSDVFISANAFLNTNGGILIIGIEDDETNNRYVFKGFDTRNEEKLKLFINAFTNTDGEPVDVTDNFIFEMKPFMGGNVLAIYVDPVLADQKNVKYRGFAYERTITGDRKIPDLNANVIEDATPVPQAVPQSDSVLSTLSQDTKIEPGLLQKLYSSELITLFGSDYISLEPDYKQMLSFIYERNNSTEDKFPKAEDICNTLWKIKRVIGTEKEYEFYRKKIKRAIAQLEKNGLIHRADGKQGYSLNTSYRVTVNLFS